MVAASTAEALRLAICAARSGSSLLSSLGMRSPHPLSQLRRRLDIELNSFEPTLAVHLCDHAVLALCRLDRDHAVANILDHAHGIAVERIAPAAAAGAAHHGAGIRRHLIPIGVDRAPIIVAWLAHEPLRLTAGMTAPQAPGRHPMTAGLCQIP